MPSRNNLTSLKRLVLSGEFLGATPFNCPCGESLGCNLAGESSTCDVTRDVTTSTEASAFRVIRASCASSAGYLSGDSTDVRPASVPQELPRSLEGILQGQIVPGGSHPRPSHIFVFFYYPHLHGVRKWKCRSKPIDILTRLSCHIVHKSGKKSDQIPSNSAVIIEY